MDSTGLISRDRKVCRVRFPGGPQPFHIESTMMSHRTLILAPWMAPQRIARWDKAIGLILDNKVDVLESYEDEEVRSAGNRHEGRSPLVIPVPAVVRLRRSDRKKGTVKFSRINVYARDHYRCCYCGEKFTAAKLNYDHVIPRVRGGKTVWENIVTSCYPCNDRKGSKSLSQSGMRMHYQPHVPNELPQAPLLLDVNASPEVWKPYLAGYGYAAVG